MTNSKRNLISKGQNISSYLYIYLYHSTWNSLIILEYYLFFFCLSLSLFFLFFLVFSHLLLLILFEQIQNEKKKKEKNYDSSFLLNNDHVYILSLWLKEKIEKRYDREKIYVLTGYTLSAFFFLLLFLFQGLSVVMYVK